MGLRNVRGRGGGVHCEQKKLYVKFHPACAGHFSFFEHESCREGGGGGGG